jgi:hypothetical protein
MASKKSGSPWSGSEIETMKRMRKEGCSYAEVSEKIGRSVEGVTHMAKDLGVNYMKLRKDVCKAPPGETVVKGNFEELTVVADDCIVAGDFHVPGESPKAVNDLLRYAKEHDIKTLIINGDFWNFDSVSRWQLKDPGMNLKIEIKKGIALVKKLAAQFKLYFVCGNHDARLPKALNYSLNFTDWMDALFGNEVFVTNFDYLKLESGKATFRICHPEYYSKVKGTQAAELAHDLQENIIMAHQHYISVSTNKTGKFICADSGCMCDPEAFYYKKSATTKFPSWENGFIHVKDGKVKLVSQFTF